MKVLAIASYGDLGGSGVRMATFLEHRPQHVEAEAVLVADGPLRGYIEERGIHVTTLSGYEGRPGARELLRFTREMGPLLDRARPDVVWAMGQKAALLAAARCRARRVPLVWHKVDFSWDRVLAKPVAVAVNGVVAPSRALVDALGPLRGRRFLGVVNPALRLGDVDAAPDPARPVVGTVGRLVPYKGHHHIIRAAASLSEEFPELRVVLAGGPAPEYPDYPATLERLAAELGMRDRVEMPGFVHDVAGVLRGMTIFVNATYRDESGFGLEGLSGAMLEASWMGLPLVATRGGGTAEGIEDGRTGTLIDAAEPDLIADAVRPYLRDPELAARVGARGKGLARARFAPAPASAHLFELLAGVAA